MSLLLKLVGTATAPVAIHDYRHTGGLVVTSWVPVGPVAVQGVNASYRKAGSFGVNAWDYVVPAGVAIVDTPVNPGVGTLTITGFAPTVSQSAASSIQPGVGSLTITGFAPTVSQSSGASYGLAADYRNLGGVQITSWLNDGLGTPPGTSVSPSVGSIAITGYAPTVVQAALPTAISSSYRAFGSLRTNDWSYVPVTSSGIAADYRGFGSLQITSWLNDGVSVSLPNTSIVPDVGTIVITGYAPTVTQSTVGTSVNPGVGTLSITGFAPSIAQTTNNSVQLGTGGIAITGYAPTVVNSGVIQVDQNLPGFDMRARKYYIRRNGKILLFNSAHEADSWLEAEQEAERAVQAAQKTSRLARKRIRERVLKVNAAPLPEVIDQAALGSLIDHFGLQFDLGALIQQANIEQILAIQELARRMQDEEEVELLLLTM